MSFKLQSSRSLIFRSSRSLSTGTFGGLRLRFSDDISQWSVWPPGVVGFCIMCKSYTKKINKKWHDMVVTCMPNVHSSNSVSLQSDHKFKDHHLFLSFFVFESIIWSVVAAVSIPCMQMCLLGQEEVRRNVSFWLRCLGKHNFSLFAKYSCTRRSILEYNLILRI